MKRIGKIIVLVSIILTIAVLVSYKKKINAINETRSNENNHIVEVNIIDQNNNLSKLYQKPQEEKYVLVDMIIDHNYYYNVGIRTKGSSAYTYLKMNKLNNYSFKVKLDYLNKDQKYRRNDRNIFKYKCI